MKVLRHIIGGMLIGLYLIASFFIAALCVITIIPLMALLVLPELLVIWLIPLLLFLHIGDFDTSEIEKAMNEMNQQTP